MYTICWTDDDGFEHYDRYNNSDEIFADEKLAPYLADEDTMVFLPESDDHWMSGAYFVH